MSQLAAYLPVDRYLALATRSPLPDRAEGTVLFADVSGFTPLTESLVKHLGPQRAAEELTHTLNQLYSLLIDEVHTQQGSVIGFAGDAMTCWFNEDQGARAATAAWRMQQAMSQQMSMPDVPLSLKISVVSGPVRRFLLGEPTIQHLDTLAGETLVRMAAADKVAQRGEVLLSAEIVTYLATAVTIHAWRESPESGESFGVLSSLREPASPSPWPELPPLPHELVRSWLLRAVYERVQAGQADFLAELRPAVVLFIRFDGIAYDQDEAAGTKLDGFIRWLQQRATQQGGVLLDLIMGDKGSYLYLVFGAPISRSDASSRAVATALDLQRAPPHLSFLKPFHMGITQGQMRVGSYGSRRRRTYGVLGDKVNLAARLMQAAPPGDIWCDQDTFQSARRHWDFEPLPPLWVKGKAEAVRAYRPTGQRRVPSLSGAPGVTQQVMVGREVERAQLVTLVEQVVQGQGRILVVEGEAGIGKSRLVSELLHLLHERDLAALVGAGQSIEQQTPYRAWQDIFTDYFDLTLEGDLPTRQARIQRVVMELAPEHESRLPLLNGVLGVEFAPSPLTAALSPELRQQNLVVLALALLRAWTQKKPLILILEDAHWLDTLSWELTIQVARAFSAHPVPFLLVAVTRPLAEHEHAARQVEALLGASQGKVMVLTTIDPRAMEALVAAHLGLASETLPEPIGRLIRERAGGNPFFAEELLYALQEQGLIAIREEMEADGRSQKVCLIQAQLDDPQHRLPDTLHGLILARLDRLPPERQLTLKVAAVIGCTFALTPLHYLLNRQRLVTEEELALQLEELSRRDFTRLDAWEREPTYLFKHLITQEAIYQTLLFSQRRELHESIARWYERTFEPLALYYPLLVHHYRHAELPVQERQYAELAAHETARQFANAEAITYLSRALSLTPAEVSAEHYRLLRAREELYDRCGDREAQAQDLRTLATLAEQGEEAIWRIEVALRQANYLIGLSDFTQAMQAAEGATRLAEQGGHLLGHATGLLHGGIAAWRLGSYGVAEEKLKTALRLAEASGDGLLLGLIWRNLGTTYFLMETPEDARHCYEQALSLCRATNDLVEEGAAFTNLGNLAISEGNYTEAQYSYEEALRLNRLVGNRAGEATVLYNLAELLYSLGEYGKAESVATQAGAIFEAIGDKLGARCEVPALLGRLAYEKGEYTQAGAWSWAAIQASREIDTPFSLSTALRTAGRVYGEEGRWKEAEGVLRQSLEVAVSINDTPGIWESQAALASTRMRLGRTEVALAAVETIWQALQKQTIPAQVIPVICLCCHDVWETCGDLRASELLGIAEAAVRGMEVKLTDEAQRRSFLENVTDHRVLQQRLTALRTD